MTMKKRRIRILLPLLILLLSLGAFSVGRILNPANHLVNDLDAMQSFGQDRGSSSTELFVSFEPLLKQTANDYRQVRSGLGPSIYLAPLFGWLPKYGGDIENAPALFDLADRIIESAENALPLLTALDSAKGDSQSPMSEILQVISAQNKALEQSRQDFLQASLARQQVKTGRLSPSVRQIVERIDQFLLMWQTALDAATIVPTELGGDNARVYLLLAQNSDELRPTGGFISSVALVRVNRGDISVADFQDSYAVDDLTRFHPLPPPALSKYMLAGMLVFRDTNWYPDFPTTARAAQNIYRVDRGIATDGVIAVNLNGIPRLIDAISPITIEPGGERVDGSNVMEKVRSYWAPPPGTGPTPDWWNHRKDFMAQLLNAVMKRIKGGDYSRVKLARSLAEAVASKDLLVYIKDVDEAKQAKFVWSGAIKGQSGDALMIVDSNVGFNKVDVNLDRHADYSAAIDDRGAIHATLTITYANLSAPDGKPCIHQPYYPPTYADLQQGCYWDYVRVIAPPSSRLIKVDGVTDGVTEPPINDRTVFGGFLVVGRGETRTVQFEYMVPASSENVSHYSLNLEKQPGAPNFPVQVHVTLPSGMIMRSADPIPHSQSGGTTNFSLELDRDQRISIEADPLLIAWTGWLALAIGVLVVGGVVFFRRRKQPSPGH
jgi:uncharacterized protein DUF4012